MIKLAITPGDWPQIVGTGSEAEEIDSVNACAELLFSEGHKIGARVVLENMLELLKLRAALKDTAKHIWRGDWDKLDPETRALLGEKP
jgi:hypothetical protein